MLCLLAWRLGALVLLRAAGCAGGTRRGVPLLQLVLPVLLLQLLGGLLHFMGSVSKVPRSSPEKANL